ncbi:hypothetical protein NIIDMKKI_53880 [Mycobacterium kansasii]|uniref:Short chain dehydrogenase family protein n=1 Tax=Mycobacterium kansasii TaxID=1768 RepID=A0A7G1IJR4_MYCKA|nr:hypothetical protein NIIDMKKI_53880 [Mycobacterium kansasii]
MTSHLAAVLVTGANTGLGREVARTLARVDGVERVYVSCRSEEKAYKAADNLGRIAGRQIYQPLMMDLTELRSVTAAIDGLDDFVDGIIMNAGGTGGRRRTRGRPQALLTSSRQTCWDMPLC